MGQVVGMLEAEYVVMRIKKKYHHGSFVQDPRFAFLEDIAFCTVQYELSFPSFLCGSQLREQNRIDSLTLRAERLKLL